MKKLFLSILVTCSLLSGNAYAGFFKDFFRAFHTNSTSGCAYDYDGRKIECVRIEYGGENGLTWNDATRQCVSYLRKYVNLDEGSTGGCT